MEPNELRTEPVGFARGGAVPDRDQFHPMLFGFGFAHELPELDVSLRGAVSIARRLQDPLAELVKIDPQSIGVGQYQHDLSEHKLSRSLDAVVEDCVNAVGVDVNTASTPLLSRVSGIGGRSHSMPASGDAMAEAFRRAGLAGNTGRQ
jgi:uncharacterized protein